LLAFGEDGQHLEIAVALDIGILDRPGDLVDRPRNVGAIDGKDGRRRWTGTPDHLGEAAGQDAVPTHPIPGNLERIVSDARAAGGRKSEAD